MQQHAMVRTFRAPDARSALAKVKSALGGDAVILATREIPGGLFRASEIEVTAGLTDESLSESKPPQTNVQDAHVPSKAQANDRGDEMMAIRAQMEEMRRELRDVRSSDAQNPAWKMAPAASMVMQSLEQRGVEPALAEELLRNALTSANSKDATSLFAEVRNLVAGKVRAGVTPWRPNHRSVLALVGPTGVGKTTTLAKIAARALMESEAKVALITVDTYRIGASDQLARYGEIMRVPTFVARDRGELTRIVERTKDFDLVLIDTAGRSNSEAVAKQADLIRAVPSVELALVLSLASGAKDIGAAAERYKVLRPDHLIVTKVDEAAAPGGLLSAIAKVEKNIACVADGQRVPEDIHGLSSEELVSLITGNLSKSRADAA